MFPFCEICFRQPKVAGCLWLSSCQHMICRRCMTSTSSCGVCQQACRMLELRPEKVPDQVKEYFSAPEQLLIKWLKVTKFQQDKQDAFIAGRIDIFEKYEAKKNKVMKLKQHYDAVKKALDEEKELIRKIREQRKSPGTLYGSPVYPVLVQSQMSSHRISSQPKQTPPTMLSSIRNNRSGGATGKRSNDSSRWVTPPSQLSGASSSSSSGRRNHHQHSSTFGSSGGTSSQNPSISPIESFKKPADLVTTARAGIYQETMRNINQAMRRPSKDSVIKVNPRGSDIERARNVHF